MAKQLPRPKLMYSFSGCSCFAAGFLIALLTVWVFSSYSNFPNPATSGFFNLTNMVGSPTEEQSCAESAQGFNLRYDPPEKTLFDDPKIGYTIHNRIVGWDEKRQDWLKLHPSFAGGGEERVLILSGSQPKPCKNQSGLVYLLLKEKEKWGNKIYLEDKYYFEGYWVEIVGTLDNITEKYKGIK